MSRRADPQGFGMANRKVAMPRVCLGCHCHGRQWVLAILTVSQPEFALDFRYQLQYSWSWLAPTIASEQGNAYLQHRLFHP